MVDHKHVQIAFRIGLVAGGGVEEEDALGLIALQGLHESLERFIHGEKPPVRQCTEEVGRRHAVVENGRARQMAGKRKGACTADQEARWRAMIEEATFDCYNEYEEFAWMLSTLEDRLAFPFPGRVLGETVEVVVLDEEQSSERLGVVRVSRGRQQYTVALADLEAVEKDTKTAEWLAAYRYWLGK